MAWETSVSSVVDVLGWEESVWDVELVEIGRGELHVVFDTIVVGVIHVSLWHWAISVLKEVQVIGTLDQLLEVVETLLRLGPSVEGEGRWA